MGLSRRRFLQSSSLFLGATLIPESPWAESVGSPATDAPGVFPVLQGETDQTSTCFMILHKKSWPFYPRAFGPDGQSLRGVLVESFSVPGTDCLLSEIHVVGLIPGVDHELRFYGHRGEILDRRVFRALNVLGGQCRFAIVSCMYDGHSGQSKMWGAVGAQNPDFVLFLGDTVYADSNNDGSSAAGFGRRYAETRQRLDWFRRTRLVPSFAVWDDHDFGLNNADRFFPMANVTTDLFRRFWGTKYGRLRQNGHGVGSMIEMFGQRFFLMDDRTFRDPSGPGARHWGDEQTSWLLEKLGQSNKPAWILNGSQFFGGYLGTESYEGEHNRDFKTLLQSLSRVEAPVCFASGDVHFSEVMEIEKRALGYTTFELTSSSIHSMTFPYHQMRAKNPRRLMSEWRNNFLMVESDVRNGWKLQTECHRAGGQVLFRHEGRISRG